MIALVLSLRNGYFLKNLRVFAMDFPLKSFQGRVLGHSIILKIYLISGIENQNFFICFLMMMLFFLIFMSGTL